MDWQPIETAPKDGTRVIVWAEGEVLIACFSPEHPFLKRRWLYDHDGMMGLPTHWMPLPAPPGKEAAA